MAHGCACALLAFTHGLTGENILKGFFSPSGPYYVEMSCKGLTTPAKVISAFEPV